MAKKINRFLALLLALALVVTTFGSDFATARVYADDGETEEVQAEEPEVQEIVEEAPEEEPPVEDEEPAEEEPVEEVINEGPEEAQPVEGETVAPTEETPAEDIEAPEEETPEEEEPAEEEPVEEEEKEEPKEEKPEGVITITYKALEGGSVSPEEETVDLKADEVTYVGSTATAEEGYVFTGWTDKDGNPVSEDENFVPSDLTEDAEFTAAFEAVAEEPEEEEEPEENLPHVTYKVSANGITVSIDAPEGAFPEGTEINVTPEYSDAVIDSIKAAVSETLSDDQRVARVVAVDISFVYQGKEIEPLKPISVRMTSTIIANSDEAKIAHVDDSNNAEVIGANVDGASAEFESAQFSIYAIIDIENPDEVITPRRTYVFETAEGEPCYFENELGEPVNEQIIKNGDKLTAVEAPFVEGSEFDNWYIYDGEDYTETVVKFETAINDVTEDETVTVRPKYISRWSVTYYNEKDAIITKAFADEEGKFTISEPYEPEDPNSAFFGWSIKSGKDNIESGELIEDFYFKNDTDIVITGDVELKAYTPAGHWLIFHENAKGATYTPSVFVRNGELTQKPDDPSRKGYTFKGWFPVPPAAGQTDPTGTEFEFGSTISENTDLYAKWQAAETAPYTIIIWKQNLECNGYDYAESITVKDPARCVVGQEVGGIELYEDDCYVMINNKKYGGPDNKASNPDPAMKKYIGFKPVRYDEHVVISPEGNTIVNIYFDRMSYNFKFRIGRKLNNGRVSVYLWGNKQQSTEISFTASDIPGAADEGSYICLSLEAKYGQTIGWPEYSLFDTVKRNTGYGVVSWILDSQAEAYNSNSNNGGETVKGKITIMDEQILGNWKNENGNGVDARFYQGSHEYRYFICVRSEDQSNITVNESPYTAYAVGQNVIHAGVRYTVFEIADSRSGSEYNGQKAPTYRGYSAIRNGEFYEYKELHHEDIHGSSYEKRDIAFYYTRNTGTIAYMDGVYKDSKGNNVDGLTPGSEFKVTDPIAYETDLSSYNKGGSNYYVPNAPYEGLVFEGWYKDKECTDRYTFTIMGDESIIVYAKWILKSYRVFLHPNADEKEGYEIGDQGMCFLVDFGGKVTPTSPIASGYEFVGWYLDPGFNKMFNSEATPINESTTTAYNQTEDTELDQLGHSTKEGYNADKENGRFWVTGKIDIYARWRSRSIGAKGINIEYDVNGNLTKVTDSNFYADGATATANGCDDEYTEGDTTYVFDHWVLQKYDKTEEAFKDTNKTLKQGGKFGVYISNAKKTELPGSTADNPKFQYVVRLRAVYKDKSEDQVKLTKIVFNGNGGKTPDGKTEVVKDKLPLNTAVTVENFGFEKPGWELTGWKYTNKAGQEVIVKEGDVVGVDNLDPKDNTLYAQWKQLTFTVTYKDGVNGDVFTDQINDGLEYGKLTPSFRTTDPSGEPKRAGWTFTGWDKDIAEKVYEDAVYTAQWKQNTYTVTYKDGANGEAFVDQPHDNLKYGDATPKFGTDDPSGEPKRAGWTFTGWDKDIAEKVYEDAVYTAQWKQNAYTVTYKDGADGEVFGDQKNEGLKYGDATPKFDTTDPSGEPKRDGYAFTGWDKPVAEKVYEDAEYIAQWSKLPTIKVIIEGKEETYPYNGEYRTVSGFTSRYEVVDYGDFEEGYEIAVQVALKDESKGTLKEKDVKTYETNCTEDDFNITADGVTVDSVTISQNKLTITPLQVIVKIQGNYNDTPYEYDGFNHSEKGYTVSIENAAADATADAQQPDAASLYSEDKIVFDVNGDGTADSKDAAIAEGFKVGHYNMNLTEGTFTNNQGQFTNSDVNFEVTFIVKNGYMDIANRAKKYVVTITSPDVPSTYNGEEQTYTILAGVNSITTINPVQSAVKYISDKIASFFTITADASDGGVEFVVHEKAGDVTYKIYNVEVSATGKEVGSYAFQLTSKPYITLNGEDVTDQFEIKTALGNLIISSAPGPNPNPNPNPNPTPSTPSTPTTIVDTPTPTAPAAAVLGAQREVPQAAVLGARRGRTEDASTSTQRTFAIIIAAAVATAILLLGRRKEDKETK